MKNTVENNNSLNSTKNKNTSTKLNFLKYLTRKNIIFTLIALIALTSWLQPEIMKQILSILWAIIY